MSYRTMLPLLLAAVFLTVAGSALAQLPNLTSYYNPNFTYPLTPTDTQVTTWPVILPPTLQGNADATYLSFATQNNGNAGANEVFSENIWLDGESPYVGINGYLAAGSTSMVYGLGPYNVRGGRHTLGFSTDTFDEIVESNENDNVWAHQFVFTPYVLSESTPKTRGAPPYWAGGWDSIVDGSPVAPNCDGFRFSSTGWWNVITLYATDNMDEYDLELHTPSTGSENGFYGSTCGSYNLEGILDAVIVNRNTVSVADYDVGVYNTTIGGGWFFVEQVVSLPAGIGADMSVALGTDEYLLIWDTNIDITGWITVSVDDPSADGEDIMVGWAENDATELSLADITTWEVTDDNGQARLHRDFTTTGYYGLIVYRNPRDGGAAKTLNVKIEPTPPDLQPGYVHLWHSPLVPTPVPIPYPQIPTLPDTLYGFMPQTYLNFGIENRSEVPAPGVDVSLYQDGIVDNPYLYVTSGYLAKEVRGSHGSFAYEYPGGRHTLTMEIDYTETIHEIYETNNFYGEQFCWSPLELALGLQHSHGAPGPAMGGVGTHSTGEIFYYNCDGYRLYTGYANWEALVLTQGPNSDYDLAVHYALEGVKDGFDDFLVNSANLMGQTDYVLFNNNLLPAMAHDVGVENFHGDEPYTIEAVGSTNLPVPVGGHYGPFTLPVSNMLHLYNIFLDQDVYAFRLDNLAGGVDWSIALHPHDVLRLARGDVVANGSANLNGPGDPEWFTVDVQAAGWYCLAVCKAEPFGFDLEGQYKLTILQGVSDVPDEPDLPAITALSGVHPNPFNPQTTISYELAVAAVVELEIYDVKGALVRRLVREAMPAGRHAAVWNGEDDGGARVASGVYLARFSAGAYRDFTKLLMVK